MVQFDLKRLFRVPTPEQRIAGLNLRPDLTRAVITMVSDPRSDDEVRRLQGELRESESVIIVVEGRRDRQLGLLTLTTEGVIFRPHGSPQGAAFRLPLTDITDVEDEIGSMTGHVVLRADESVVQVDKLLGRQAGQFAEALRRQLADPGPPADRDPVQELLDLRARHAEGAISDAEFREAKARLLDEL